MLREHLPELLRVAVEPGESAVLSGGAPGTHHIEGGGIGRWPPQLRPGDVDEVVAVPEADAFAKAREAARGAGRPGPPRKRRSSGPSRRLGGSTGPDAPA